MTAAVTPQTEHAAVTIFIYYLQSGPMLTGLRGAPALAERENPVSDFCVMFAKTRILTCVLPNYLLRYIYITKDAWINIHVRCPICQHVCIFIYIRN